MRIGSAHPGETALSQRTLSPEEESLRKYLIVALAAMVSIALTAASAFAALDHTVTAKVTPSKAGTKKKPRNIKVSAGVNVVRTAPDATNPTAGRIEFYLPKQFAFNNKRFKKCSKAALDTQGVSACPKGSQIGSGTASATVGPTDAPLDFDTTFFNSGSKSIAIHLQRVTIVNGQRQDAEGSFASPTGKLTKASGKYGTKLTVVVPETVKNTTAGFSKLIGLEFTMDKKYKGQTFIRSTGCKKNYPINSRLLYEPNPTAPSVTSTSKATTVPCKKP
jgi:hypothetical protein